MEDDVGVGERQFQYGVVAQVGERVLYAFGVSAAEGPHVDGSNGDISGAQMPYEVLTDEARSSRDYRSHPCFSGPHAVESDGQVLDPVHEVGPHAPRLPGRLDLGIPTSAPRRRRRWPWRGCTLSISRPIIRGVNPALTSCR